jgi:hypothetical protein
MPITVASIPQAAAHRRVCSWCRGDLGPLTHPSQHDSYGICPSCAQHYFAYLYESDEGNVPPILRERAVGADTVGNHTLLTM